MNTFTKEITFLSKTYDAEKVTEQCNGWVDIPVTKTVTFSELDRKEKKQHKLHFAVVSLFSNTFSIDKEDDKKVNLDTDQIYDMTIRAIRDLLIVDSNFTETDKKEFMADSGALFDFGFWLIGEKLVPFFQILMNVQTA